MNESISPDAVKRLAEIMNSKPIPVRDRHIYFDGRWFCYNNGDVEELHNITQGE